MSINLHIYPSHFQFESRIVKQTKAIAEQGLFDEIIILAFWKEGLQTEQQIDDKRKVIRIKTFFEEKSNGNKLLKLLAFIELFLKSILYFNKHDVHLINCHSLTVLPLSCVLKWLKKSVLVYDTHELETERNGLQGIRKKLESFSESLLIKHVDAISVVGPSIMNWYVERYSWTKPICVLRNIPETKEINSPKQNFRAFFKIPDTSKVFLYQGLVAKGRGIPELIAAFEKLDNSNHLIVMGYGAMEEFVRSNPSTNIHWFDAVPQNEVLGYTAQADVGLSLGENVCLSYYLSLPNKMFEYIKCGVPVLSSNFPDMETVIQGGDCGWNIEPKREKIYEFISALESSAIKEKSENTISYRSQLEWSTEIIEYLKLIEKVSLMKCKN